MELLTIMTMIKVLATTYHVEPEIALAVAQTESKFNVNAVGKLGEIGLFQVRPEHSKVSKNKLFMPLENINEGLRMLSEAKSRCRHKKEATWVTCYNAGISGGSKYKKPKENWYYKKVMAARRDFFNMALGEK